VNAEDPEALLAVGSRTWASTDGARSWTEIGGLCPRPGGNTDAIALAANARGLAMGGAELWVSDSAGAFWEERGERLPIEDARVDGLTFSPDDASTIYARVRNDAGEVAIARTNNTGHTWTEVHDNDDGIDFTDDPLVSVPGQPTTVLSSSWVVEGSAYVISLDITWGSATDVVRLGQYDRFVGMADAGSTWVIAVARLRAD
jgi:photosystem II stability/assembly factor-like uncharacterized protein